MSASIPGSVQAQALTRLLGVVSFPIAEDQRRALMDCVDAFVDEHLIAGTPLEGVIVAIKHVAREAGLCPRRHLILVSDRTTDADELICDLVAWAVARYYDFEH